MTELYYSNLPPEAQKAIQKLTGLTGDELEDKTLDEIDAIKLRTSQPTGPSTRTYLKRIAAKVIIIAACWGLLVLVIYTCAR